MKSRKGISGLYPVHNAFAHTYMHTHIPETSFKQGMYIE